MSNFISVLEHINQYYSRYIYIILPALSAAINAHDLLFKSSSTIQKLGNASVFVIVIVLSGLYIHTGRNNLFIMCCTITLTAISLFMFVTRRVEISNSVGIIFICFYAVMLGVTFAVKMLAK
jgi:hypothetical protein